MAEGNVTELLLGSYRSDVTAISCGSESVSYGDLVKRVDDLARALVAAGYEKSDRIGLMSDNSPFFICSYLAILKAGLCAVPFQVSVSQKAFETIVSSTGMPMMLSSKKYAKKTCDWSRGYPVEVWLESNVELPDIGKVTTVAEKLGHAHGKFPAIDPRRDMAAIMFTSGSTGEPKGVVISHHNIECNTREIISYMGIDDNDRAMVVLPFYYCYGMSLLHTHLAIGATVVLNNSFMFPEKVLDDMSEKACTGFAGVPSTYQILLRRTTFKRRKFPNLKWFQQAGGNLPVPFIREVREAFPDVAFYVMYGQTEATARLSYLPPNLLESKIGSIGKGLDSIKLEVINEGGTPVEPGTDEIGEVVASGDSIALGYWDDPGETAKYFKQGRLHTGDIARVDNDGYIYLVDRERDFVKCMGHRVSTKEIEDTIAEIPSVVETAAVGTPHELYGEAIVAFVVPRRANELTEDGVIKHCLGSLPNFKVPHRVIFIKSIPKSDVGKILKSELKKLELFREI